MDENPYEAPQTEGVRAPQRRRHRLLDLFALFALAIFILFIVWLLIPFFYDVVSGRH